MESKQVDSIILLAVPICAAALTAIFRPGLIFSVLMFFGLPSGYLIVKNPSLFKKSAVFALVVSVPLSLFVDALAAVNGAWLVPRSIFQFRFFGVATVDVYCFGLFWALFAVLFHGHFVDRNQFQGKISPSIFTLITLSTLLVVYAVIGFQFDRALLNIPYFYAVVGIGLVVIPLFVFFIRYPHSWRRLVVTGFYFVFLLSVFEMAALYAGQWVFPGTNFVGYISIFGYHIPVEEFVIWICLATPSLISYYESLVDDRLLRSCGRRSNC